MSLGKRDPDLGVGMWTSSSSGSIRGVCQSKSMEGGMPYLRQPLPPTFDHSCVRTGAQNSCSQPAVMRGRPGGSQWCSPRALGHWASEPTPNLWLPDSEEKQNPLIKTNFNWIFCYFPPKIFELINLVKGWGYKNGDIIFCCSDDALKCESTCCLSEPPRTP